MSTKIHKLVIFLPTFLQIFMYHEQLLLFPVFLLVYFHIMSREGKKIINGWSRHAIHLVSVKCYNLSFSYPTKIFVSHTILKYIFKGCYRMLTSNERPYTMKCKRPPRVLRKLSYKSFWASVIWGLRQAERVQPWLPSWRHGHNVNSMREEQIIWHKPCAARLTATSFTSPI